MQICGETKSAYRTMLLSVLMSAWGPVILGLGLRAGHSSTQISDFTRRSAELLALIVALIVFVKTERTDVSEARRHALRKMGSTFTGVIMCVSGICMVIVAFLTRGGDKGNVIPALAVALLGVIANSLFWRKYTVLYKTQGNSILGVQARLYGAKSLVDACVTLALAAVLAFPGTGIANALDLFGSLFVSAYMIRCGIRTIKEQNDQNDRKENSP